MDDLDLNFRLQSKDHVVAEANDVYKSHTINEEDAIGIAGAGESDGELRRLPATSASGKG